MDRPETRYTSVGDADVGYQVVGNGALDLLYFWGLGGHIDLRWDWPPNVDFLARMARFSRVISFDRRGSGVSDPTPGNSVPTWEDWTEDVRAVLDATNSRRAAIFAVLEGGPMAILYAAMAPERVSALVLANTTARFLFDDDYQIGLTHERAAEIVERLRATWGTLDQFRAVNPDAVADAEYFARQARAVATPRRAAEQTRYIMESLDVREVLPLVRVPTLVLHNRDNNFIPINHGRYLAEHIDGAQLLEISSPGIHFMAGGPVVTDTIEEFLTGRRPEPIIDRVLTTVLFTDIVGSTERLVAMGDQQWKVVLDQHDRAIRIELRRFRGREIKTLGDGFHASFDGPARAIRCAQAITDVTRALGIEVRAGLHTGECEVRGEELSGLAVHIAARVGALASSGEVLVSSTVKDLVAGSGIQFVERGERQLKGVPGTWRLFAVH